MSGERTVWVEVSTELLAELGEWSEPVRVRIDDRRPNGAVEMVLQEFNDGKAALEQALARIAELEATVAKLGGEA